MVTPPDSVRRHFLPWDRPLLPQAVALLAGGWNGGAPLDLARLLVVVPTRQSGRRLREALAEHAAARGQAAFPPRVVTPEALVNLNAGGGIAARLESLLAWTKIFRGLDLDRFRDVFPIDPPARNFSWALRLAQQFAQLQAALAEAGLRIGDVVAKTGGDFPEAERWAQLGEIEKLHAARLAALGLRDAQAAKISAAETPAPLAGVDRIVVLATPDPMPLTLSALAAHAREVPVEVVVYAPAAEAAAFDAWGRPSEEAWASRAIELPEFDQRVQLCADPEAQADRIVAVARGYAAPETVLGIGVADPEVLPLLENALARAGLAAFNPEGRARRHDGLYALLAALADFAAEPGFDAAAALLRCPDVLAWLGRRAEEKLFSPATLLAELDELRSRHLPATLAAARAHADEFPAVAPALAALAELRGGLTGGEFPANAAAALTTIFGGRRIDGTAPLADSAVAWTETLRETARALARFGSAKLALAERWELALGEFAGQARTADRPANALDLLGWLELLWEDAPHLVVAGCNDGRVPDAVVGDAFLPEGLRERLGLKTNAARFARDAYLLSALAAARRVAGGRLDLLVGKTAAAGEPLRPSRLLLRCADAELPARVAQLFRPVAAARPSLPWTRAWKLQPRRVRPLERLSVTALRDYLACPFRFYLKHGLRMERVDPAKSELDARDFGTLLHAALQQLADNIELRDCADATVLRDFLLERFEAAVRARYGAELTLPLVVQFESARQRLRAAAVVEARERAAGWRTERAEWKFSFPLGGLTVSGKIDRIDRHADGRVRVLDYKSGDTATEPAKAHLRGARADDAARPAWRRCTDGAGRARVWTDLQLPLYRRAVAAEFGDAAACGYFNLPKAAGKTGVSLWEDFSREWQAAAERCAEGAVAAIVAGEFWPPAELSGREAEWDEFAELFHRGAAESVAWEGAR